LGLLLVAACALGATAVSSASASPAFLYHSAKSLLLTTSKLVGIGGTAETFETAAGRIECAGLSTDGTAPAALRFLYLLLTFHYSGCTAFGFPATVDLVSLLFHSEGDYGYEEPLLILVPSIGCTITFPTGPNQGLDTAKYDNNPNGTLLILIGGSNITSFGTGGCAYAEESLGIQTGDITVGGIGGGSLRWDP
jgi:hypothetical protein